MLMNQHVGAKYIFCRHPIVKWGDTQILCNLAHFLGHILFYLFSLIYEKFTRTDRLVSDENGECVQRISDFTVDIEKLPLAQNIYHMNMITLFSFCRSFVCKSIWDEFLFNCISKCDLIHFVSKRIRLTIGNVFCFRIFCEALIWSTFSSYRLIGTNFHANQIGSWLRTI